MDQQKTIMTLEDLIKLSDEKYLELLKNKETKTLLKAIGLFSNQTISNDVLILSQNPNATCVKRMKEWNYYRRNVKKNEKAIKVISHHLDHYDVDFTDKEGNVHTNSVEKLRADVGYLFDIAQTEGQEFQYLNSNKENIAKFFESAKASLEKTAKGFEFKYVDQEENAKIDKENKVIYIRDGLSIDELINTLVNQTTRVLLDNRRPEGLTEETKENIDQVEYNFALYAIKSKLGLDVPEFDYDQVADYTDEEKVEFKNNLQKVRSVVKQLISNFESAIEKAVRDLDKQIAEQEQKVEQEVKQEQKEPQIKKKTKSKQSESEVQ